MSKLLGICIPTNNPDIFSRIANSLQYVREIRDYSKLLIHFQDPWSEQEISSAISLLRFLNWDYSYTHSRKYDDPTPIVEIRSRCADLDPDLNYYMMIDHDFRFTEGISKYLRTSGQRYLEALHYLENHPECGLMFCHHFRGGNYHDYRIRPRLSEEVFATNQGHILRSMRDHGFLIVPDQLRKLRSGLEETLFAYERMRLGYYLAKQMNNPTERLPVNRLEYYSNSSLHDLKIIDQNIIKYIKEDYSCPDFSKDYPGHYPKELKIHMKNKYREREKSLIIDYIDFDHNKGLNQ